MGFPYNESLSEGLAVLGQLAPVSHTTTKTIGPFSTAGFHKVLFILNVGVIGSSGTIDFKVQASETSGGTYSDVTGSAITQITSGATNLVLVEVRAETLGGATSHAGGPFIKGVQVNAVAASLCSCVALGVYSYYPSSDKNAVTPTQVIVL